MSRHEAAFSCARAGLLPVMAVSLRHRGDDAYNPGIPIEVTDMRRLVAMCLFSIATTVVSAETLLIERVAEETGALPARGQSMAQVEARFGTPTQRLDPRGGQKRQWPTINRWSYPNFVVYFEKNKVIDAVALRANTQEVGPKPPIL